MARKWYSNNKGSGKYREKYVDIWTQSPSMVDTFSEETTLLSAPETSIADPLAWHHTDFSSSGSTRITSSGMSTFNSIVTLPVTYSEEWQWTKLMWHMQRKKRKEKKTSVLKV